METKIIITNNNNEIQFIDCSGSFLTKDFKKLRAQVASVCATHERKSVKHVSS